MRVVVVGAGMSGLAAADAVRCAGAEVVVVEARDRIGGRTCSVPLGPGTIDLGGAWVHGPIGNPVAEALAGAGIATANDGDFGAPIAVWADGWLDAAATATMTATLQGDWDPAEARDAIASDRFVDGVEWFIADRGLEGRPADLARFALLWLVGALVIAGQPEEISLAGAAAYAEGSGGNLVPAGGYGALVEVLAAGLDVRLGTGATRIDHRGPGVSVVTDRGTVDADRAIVTVPLGVLRAGTVAFDPPLGGAHALAVERLAMGTEEKVVLLFGERFWPDSVWEMSHIADDGAFPAWFDFSRHVGAPSLVAIYNPRSTPRLAGMTSPDRVEAALDVLRAMFGSIPDPEVALATDWTRDPRSRGSYSHLPIGASVDDMSRLGEPVSERLTLAGEATVPERHGTVDAAFVSGLRAAAFALGNRPERLSLGTVPSHWAA